MKLNIVFLDTSIFIQYNFNFNSVYFKRIKELRDNYLIEIVITKITYDELIKHINLKAKDINNSFNLYLKKLTFYTDNFPKSNFNDGSVDHKIIAKGLKLKLDEWIKELEVEVLNITNALPEKVFEWYFSEKPPFDRKNKKKEFPDAFSISILLNTFPDSKISIVTKDKDFDYLSEYKNIKLYNSLSDFLDQIAQKEYDLYELIIKEYKKRKKVIIHKITNGFETFSVISKEGWFAEKPTVIKLSVLEDKIVEAKENYCLINLEIQIYFEVLVYFKEIEDYKLEKDYCIRNIIIKFEYSYNKKMNLLYDVKLKSLEPGNKWDQQIFLYEDEFFREYL